MILFEKLLANVAKKPKFVHFDDPEVERVFLVNFDKDKDGKISINESLKVDRIDGSIFNSLNAPNGTIDLTSFKNLTSITPATFRFINKINKIIMPERVTVYDTCFYASTVGEIIIPNIKNVSSFLWGLNFDNMVIKSKEPPIKLTYKVNYGWTPKSTSKIFVPDESVDKYKQSDAFSGVASYIYPLSEYNDN